jgi:ABC-type branched-subunit amino acid transport system ATPase component
VTERAKDVRAHELVDLLGLGPWAGRHVSELSTGTRRVAELGCIVALGARVLLLDEPMAGLAQREVEAFAPVLSEIRDHLGATMLVIDHDIPMVTAIADRLYVLAAGRVIAEGEPRVVREDPAVIAAYLGTDERAISRSGRVAVTSGRAARR